MQLPFKRARWQQDSEGFWLSLLIADRSLFPAVRRFVDTMKDRPYLADIKEHRKKRSLDANAYCWELIGKLSGKLRIPPEQVYREAIREIGDNYEVVPIREDKVGRWREIWQAKGLGWTCEDLGRSKLTGYINIASYYGSSVYDTAQMSRLIDYIIEECQLQEIETLPPDKLALLKDGWRDEVSKDTV